MTWYVMYQWKKSESIYNFMLKEKRLTRLCVGIIGKEIFILMLLFKHLIYFNLYVALGISMTSWYVSYSQNFQLKISQRKLCHTFLLYAIWFWTYPLSKMSIVMAWRGAAKHSVMAAASFLPVAGQHRLSTRIAYCYYCILGLFPGWLGVEVPEG